MAAPKSVIRLNKNGVEYVSSCDKAQYLIQELTRAALRDVGKFITRRCNEKAQQLPGMRKSKRVRGKSSAFGYWARKKECDLQVGATHDAWYGAQQELGTYGNRASVKKDGSKTKFISKQPKRGFLTNTTMENIAEIVKIESQYLSALEDEAKALALIDEDEMIGGEDE